MKRRDIYKMIDGERDRQDALWGPIGRHYAKPVESGMYHDCYIQGWRDILQEEVQEVLDAKHKQERITELIQVAAVCVKWIEALAYGDKK